jgi:hypothetical protein
MDLYFSCCLRYYCHTYIAGGGLGTREIVFVKGAEYFLLDVHVAPIISILFYLSNALSLYGVYILFIMIH